MKTIRWFWGWTLFFWTLARASSKAARKVGPAIVALMCASFAAVGCTNVVRGVVVTADENASALDACDRELVTDDPSLTSQLYAEHAFPGLSVPELLDRVSAVGQWPDGHEAPVPVVVVAPGRVHALCGTMYADPQPWGSVVVTNHYHGAHRVRFSLEGMPTAR